MISHVKSRSFKMSQNNIPSLINGSAGRPAVTVAGKKCECKGCDAEIVKGEKCFDIPNPRKAFSNSRRFCQACFKLVLAKTREDVAQFEAM
jgi:hypothetical protein